MNESEETVARSTCHGEIGDASGLSKKKEGNDASTHPHSRPLLVLPRDGSHEVKNCLPRFGLRSDDVAVDRKEALLQ